MSQPELGDALRIFLYPAPFIVDVLYTSLRVAGFVIDSGPASDLGQVVQLRRASPRQTRDVSDLGRLGGNHGGDNAPFGVAHHQGPRGVNARKSPDSLQGSPIGFGPSGQGMFFQEFFRGSLSRAGACGSVQELDSRFLHYQYARSTFSLL